MENEKDHLELVLETMPAAAIRCDRATRLLWGNALYGRWHGKPVGELLGRRLEEIVGARQMQELRPYVERVLKGEEVQFERLAQFVGLGRRWIRSIWTPAGEGWVAISIDVHDRRQAEEELRRAEARKDEFLAALAHELRNPLAPIRNAIELLLMKRASDPELRWSEEVIDRQVRHMSRLLDDLLDPMQYYWVTAQAEYSVCPTK